MPQSLVTRENLKNKFLEIMRKISCKEEANGDFVWGVDFNHSWKNWFTHYEVLHPLKTINFEGLEFPCLNDPDAFLTRLYGNYMAYPPKISLGHSMYLQLSEEEKNEIKTLISSLNKEGE